MNQYFYRSEPSTQLGVTLVELMVGLVVALLLISGLIQVYLSNKQSYNAQEQLARMQESGRFAMDLITADLRRSGYWGGTVLLPNIERGLPGHEDPDHVCAGGSTEWGRMVRWRVSGLNNAATGYTCAASYDVNSNSDVLTLRYAGPSPLPTGAPLGAGTIYLRDNTDSGVIITGATATEPVNATTPIAGDDVTPRVRPLVAHAYYVGESGRTCPGGEEIPSFMRVRLNPADGTPLEEEISPGVERFEVRYLVNRAGVVEYVNADEIIVGGGIDEWLNVIAVRVWLLVRGECPERGLTDTNTYLIGDQVLTPNDSFRRQLYVSTVMLRNNVVGDRPD